MEKGDDGKENFHARKACDYLKAAVEVSEASYFINTYCIFYLGLWKSFSWFLLYNGRCP